MANTENSRLEFSIAERKCNILEANGLYKIVTGEKAMPQPPVAMPPADNPTTAQTSAYDIECLKWKKDYAKATALISSAISPTQIENVLTCNTAKRM